MTLCRADNHNLNFVRNPKTIKLSLTQSQRGSSSILIMMTDDHHESLAADAEQKIKTGATSQALQAAHSLRANVDAAQVVANLATPLLPISKTPGQLVEFDPSRWKAPIYTEGMLDLCWLFTFLILALALTFCSRLENCAQIQHTPCRRF